MFVFDGEKPLLVPMCYHPTTVLVVDDEIQFLTALRSSISKSVPLKTFDKPEDALNFVNVNGYVKARINGAGFDPLIAAVTSKVGLGTRASMHAWF